MGKLVTLDEVEEYEREERRAHAENRASVLHNPFEVFRNNLGNADSHLVEKSAAEVKSDTAALHAARKKDQAQDKRIQKAIRGSIQRTDLNGGQVLPYEAPDPSRYEAPKTAEEKAYADTQAEALVVNGAQFDDSFSDSNIPNLENGQVTGDSVNIKFTRKMTTSSPEELVRENERNSVPVPERFSMENPPQVVQQGNPITGERPTEEHQGYLYEYNPTGDNAADANITGDDMPLTAISNPRPEHVIGDETGTTRKKTHADVKKATPAKRMAKVTPLMQAQVAQGKVKRPDTMPSGGGLAVDQVGSPVDRDNKATKAAKKVAEDVRKERVAETDEVKKAKIQEKADAKEKRAIKRAAKKSTSRSK